MAGRPRRVEDATILDATVRVMGRTGPAGLTLALVAEEAGVVPATLVQRFTTKRGLILALAQHNAQLLSELREKAQGEQRPLLDALAEVVGVWGPTVTPQEFANHLAFLCADLADTQLRDLTVATHQSQSSLITELLRSGIATGELAAETDIDMLSTTIQSVVAGAGLMWAIDRNGSLADRLRASLDHVLTPHRTRTR